MNTLKLNSFKIKDFNTTTISEKDIKNLKLVKNGDIGKFSKIYKLNENECIKIFRNYDDEIYDIYKFGLFTKLNFNCAAMPTSLLIINNEFRGIKLKYIDGIPLKNLDTNMSFDDFIIIVNKLLKSLEEIGYNKIEIYDSHTENIMYDYNKKQLTLIDVDDWIFSNEKNIKEKNFEYIVSILEDFMYGIDSYNFQLFSKYAPKSRIDYYSDYIDYYLSLKMNIEQISKTKIKTLNDMRNTIKKG